MPRRAVRILFLIALGIAALSTLLPTHGVKQPPLHLDRVVDHLADYAAGGSRATWGRPETLPDHFARHGHDFGARTSDDYAAQAHAFLERAKTAGLPAKRDRNGELRVYEPATDTFGAYNADGTTKTFFKPGNPSYFDHQPGERIDLRATK